MIFANKSMHTEQANRRRDFIFASGAEMPGRPTMGAWLSYGLGSDTDSLPSFVVVTSVSKGTTCGQTFMIFTGAAGFCRRAFRA